MYLRWDKHKHNNAFCVRGFLWFRGGRFFGLLKQVVRTTLLSIIIITTTTHYYTFLLCSMYKGIGDFSWCSFNKALFYTYYSTVIASRGVMVLFLLLLLFSSMFFSFYLFFPFSAFVTPFTFEKSSTFEHVRCYVIVI